MKLRDALFLALGFPLGVVAAALAALFAGYWTLILLVKYVG